MGARSQRSRRALFFSLGLGAFVLLDLALFGWLIFRSLSARELERVLLEAQEETASVVDEIVDRTAQGEDLYTAVALEQETQTFIDSVLAQTDVVQSVEVRDLEGKLVLRADTQATYPRLEVDPLSIESREIEPQIERRTVERQRTYDLEVPIGSVGVLQIGISRGELETRVAALRAELVSKATLIAAITIGALLAAYALVVALLRRSAQLERAAQRSERMAYVGTLAAGLAHEIRNPLNALSLNLQLLEEEVGEGKRSGASHRLFAITRDEIARLDRLATDFLSYARPRPLEQETVEAGELLERCREVLRGELAAQSAVVRVRDESAGATVRVDPQRMIQLLINLVHNGLAAAREAGAPLEVDLSAREQGEEIALSVRDHGVGLPAGEEERIFDLFYSTKPGGTGLGLAVVRRVAEDHGAEISVDSKPGAGTTVTVSLPRASGSIESGRSDHGEEALLGEGGSGEVSGGSREPSTTRPAGVR